MDFDEDEDFYICELMAPETVTGEVTRVDKNTGESDEDNDNTYVRIDGNKYTYASKNHNVYDLDEGKRQHPTLNEDYTLYMTPRDISWATLWLTSPRPVSVRGGLR